MTNKDIKKIAILIEFENGNAHQVLASMDDKRIILDLLASMTGGLKVSDRIEPVIFELCEK